MNMYGIKKPRTYRQWSVVGRQKWHAAARDMQDRLASSRGSQAVLSAEWSRTAPRICRCARCAKSRETGRAGVQHIKATIAMRRAAE